MIQGRLVEMGGPDYRLTREGRKVLAAKRSGWEQFVAAINRITETKVA